jgi:uncharacterized LabA/DUF88 family protein
MRACVFVDGENFRQSIADLFRDDFVPTDYLPRKADYSAFFGYLIGQSQAANWLRAYWFVVQDIEFWPPEVPENADDLDSLVAYFSSYELTRKAVGHGPSAKKRAFGLHRTFTLRREKYLRIVAGWRDIQNKIAESHDHIEFRRAGYLTYNLLTGRFSEEKGVDVNLAVDLVQLAPTYELAVIVAGDGDYIPAVQAVKDLGKRVVNVAFERHDGSTLPVVARQLRIVADREVRVPFDVARKILLGK